MPQMNSFSAVELDSSLMVPEVEGFPMSYVPTLYPGLFSGSSILKVLLVSITEIVGALSRSRFYFCWSLLELKNIKVRVIVISSKDM